jgi:hypothetical protein
MNDLHGFELVREQHIAEINSHVRLLRHVKTGAQLLSVENSDENKVFGITFRTPPPDNTGLPHILEHAVLAGSRKYPLKEPFVELLKGSMATFINAMTFDDRTAYPVASQNVRDFYNLIDVYLDAVFYPRIRPEILEQEGWHYELDNIDDPLNFRGIVFNEMKGAYSSPDRVMTESLRQRLFPDNAYGRDAGGSPAAIPDLTFEQFKRFHETYYHPSNALIWFYGDDDPAERLRIVEGYLKDYDRLSIDAQIALQARWDEPRREVVGYDAGEDNGRKGMVTVSWMLGEPSSEEERVRYAILEHILLGTPASPPRKALIDSGLGEDLAGFGIDDNIRQYVFATGLKGIAVGDAGKVEALILNTLESLARDGIDPETVAASLNTLEFQWREYNTGNFPRGLAMMFSALSSWAYGGDPFAALAYEAPLNALKARLNAGEKVFESMIRSALIDNTHRSVLVLQPDSTVREQREAAERARLDAARAAMSESDLRAVIDNTRKLRLMQETPDSPELLARVPSLSISDLDRENKRIPLEVIEGEDRVLYHDLFTNGVIYLDAGFDLRALPAPLLPYVSLFGKALLEMGTRTQDYVRLSQRIGSRTGGIAPSTIISQKRNSKDLTAWLFLRAKATPAQADDLLAILHDVLQDTNFDNQERFRQIVLKEKAMREARLVPMGSAVVNTRLNGHFHTAGWAAEQTDGISFLFFLRQLVERIERDWASVLADLEAIRAHLLRRGGMIANVTVDSGNWRAFQPKLSRFLADMPAGLSDLQNWSPALNPIHEGLAIPAQVNYVSKGANLYDLGYTLHGSIQIIQRYLRMTWLWERIRVQGGAYGAATFFDAESGVWNFSSYRDPNLLVTLDVYDKAADFLAKLDLSEAERVKSIVAGIGQMDTYLLPDAKGFVSMQRYLIGYSDEQRQQFREEILSATAQDFRRFGEVLRQLNNNGLIAVLGSQQAIDAANAQRDHFLNVIQVL